MNPCARLPREVARAVAAGVAVALLVVQFGCATQAPSLDLHWQLRNEVTALVPARLETKLSIEPFATGRTAGALMGAGEGFVGCLHGVGNGSCSGDACAALLLFMLALAVTCSAVGAVAGAIQATPVDEADMLAGSIDQVSRQLANHLNLTRHVLLKADQQDGLTVDLIDEKELVWMEDVQRWQVLRERGFANALEIGVTDIEFSGGMGSDPELALRMVARVRLIELATGEEKYREELSFWESPRRFSLWTANQGAIMRRAVEKGLESLSATIASRLFEQVALPVPSGFDAVPWSSEFGCCWLCPQSPPHDIAHEFWQGAARVKYSKVLSRQPELVWEAFPRPAQAAALREVAGTDSPVVRYDLRLWELRKEQPGPLVYERRGLVEPRHRLETPLKPGWRYFWSFRPCFDSGRGELCLPWAFSSVPAPASCEVPAIPAANYYRFAVP